MIAQVNVSLKLSKANDGVRHEVQIIKKKRHGVSLGHKPVRREKIQRFHKCNHLNCSFRVLWKTTECLVCTCAIEQLDRTCTMSKTKNEGTRSVGQRHVPPELASRTFCKNRQTSLKHAHAGYVGGPCRTPRSRALASATSRNQKHSKSASKIAWKVFVLVGRIRLNREHPDVKSNLLQIRIVMTRHVFSQRGDGESGSGKCSNRAKL